MQVTLFTNSIFHISGWFSSALTLRDLVPPRIRPFLPPRARCTEVVGEIIYAQFGDLTSSKPVTTLRIGDQLRRRRTQPRRLWQMALRKAIANRISRGKTTRRKTLREFNGKQKPVTPPHCIASLPDSYATMLISLQCRKETK